MEDVQTGHRTDEIGVACGSKPCLGVGATGEPEGSDTYVDMLLLNLYWLW